MRHFSNSQGFRGRVTRLADSNFRRNTLDFRSICSWAGSPRRTKLNPSLRSPYAEERTVYGILLLFGLRPGAHADILCHAGSLNGVPDVREVVRLRTLLPVVAERRDDAIAVRKRLLQLLLFIQLRLDHRSRRLHVFELVRRPRDHHRFDTDLLGPGEDPLAVGR